jgi:hypothetical protein
MDKKTDFVGILNAMFKYNYKYNDISDEDKESSFFMIQKKLAKGKPKNVKMFNNKSVDKCSVVDLWYLEYEGKGEPDWYWQKSNIQKEKSKPKKYKKEEKDNLMKIYKISEEDFVYLEKYNEKELLDEIKKLRKFK